MRNREFVLDKRGFPVYRNPRHRETEGRSLSVGRANRHMHEVDLLEPGMIVNLPPGNDIDHVWELRHDFGGATSASSVPMFSVPSIRVPRRAVPFGIVVFEGFKKIGEALCAFVEDPIGREKRRLHRRHPDA